MNRFIRVTCLLILMVVSSKSILAQFTYFEGSLGFSGTRFNEVYESEANLNTFSLNFSAVRRVARPLGLGLEFEVPFFKTNTINLRGTPTSSSFNFYGLQSLNGSFAPQESDYEVRKNVVPRIILRLYLGDGYDDFYFEGRFAVSSLKEKYTFQRSAFALNDTVMVPEVDINYNGNVGYTSVGLGFGYQSTGEDGWFFRIRAGFDVVSFKESAMDFNVSYDYDSNTMEPLDFSLISPITDTSTSWFIDLGTGYYF